jgi:HAD superfamily hydrolase (TIGR01509 family)
VSEGLTFIFDLDGVIVDSNPVHVQVWEEYLRRQGISVDRTLPDLMYGRRNDDIVRDLIGDHLTPEEVFAHGAAKEALYRDVMKAQLARRLVPGISTFLSRHADILTGLATNAEPANAEFVLNESGLRRYFPVIVDGQQVARPKPDPEVYLRAARLLGRPPRDCVVFEDSIAGVQAGRAAGTRVVALTTTHASFPEADLVVENFLSPELEPWIERLPEKR